MVDSILKAIRNKVKHTYPDKEHHLIFHLYGKNAVMDELEPLKEITPHELGIVIQVSSLLLEQASKHLLVKSILNVLPRLPDTSGKS